MSGMHPHCRTLTILEYQDISGLLLSLLKYLAYVDTKRLGLLGPRNNIILAWSANLLRAFNNYPSSSFVMRRFEAYRLWKERALAQFTCNYEVGYPSKLHSSGCTIEIMHRLELIGEHLRILEKDQEDTEDGFGLRTFTYYV